MQATRGTGQPSWHHDHSTRTRHAPLVDGGHSLRRSYPTEDAIRRRAQYERKRAQRQALKHQEQTSRRNETKTFVMVMSGFLCGSMMLSMTFRIGESMLSSVVYGIMIGVAVNLIFLIAVAALDKFDGAYAYDYDCFDDEDGEYEEVGADDFAGLGSGVDASDMFRQDGEEPRKSGASAFLYGKGQRRPMPKLLGGRPQKDMRSFLDALSSDLEPEQADVVIH